MSDADFQDVGIVCKDCARVFTWTAGEQKYFAERDYQRPKRCQPCRRIFKEQQRESGAAASEAGRP